MPKVIPVPDAEYARQKAEVAARCVKAQVTGDQPIRDAITRESVEPGGTVSLDPKTTNLELLERGGAIRLIATTAGAQE